MFLLKGDGGTAILPQVTAEDEYTLGTLFHSVTITVRTIIFAGG